MRFTSPAVVQAVALSDSHGLAIAPERVAATLQRQLSELVSQGYQVLGVTLIPGALLCTALKRAPDRALHWYGCEGLTCRPGSHTLDCPNIDQSG